MRNACVNQSSLTGICCPLRYERVYLPLYKVAYTPFHIQGNDVSHGFIKILEHDEHNNYKKERRLICNQNAVDSLHPVSPSFCIIKTINTIKLESSYPVCTNKTYVNRLC